MNQEQKKPLALLPTNWPSSGKALLDIPFVPTPEEIVEHMLALAQVTKKDILYDLGCGDGRIVITAAKKRGTQGFGVDLDPKRIRECRKNAVEAGVTEKVSFHTGSLFEAEFSDATVIAIYLLSSVNLKMRSRFLTELKPGTRIVSHDFSMDKWSPDKSKKVTDHMIYLWYVPSNISGTWRWKMPRKLGGDGTYTMSITQLFQRLWTKVSGPQPSVRATNLTLQGNSFEAVIEEFNPIRRFTLKGTVEGDSIKGFIEVPDFPTLKWLAERDPLTKGNYC